MESWLSLKIFLQTFFNTTSIHEININKSHAIKSRPNFILNSFSQYCTHMSCQNNLIYFKYLFWAFIAFNEIASFNEMGRACVPADHRTNLFPCVSALSFWLPNQICRVPAAYLSAQNKVKVLFQRETGNNDKIRIRLIWFATYIISSMFQCQKQQQRGLPAVGREIMSWILVACALCAHILT